MNTAHLRLREATGAAHARVDALFGRFDLSRRDDYAGLLAAHAEALIPVEALLDRDGAQAITEDWPQRRRAGVIQVDLDALGIDMPESGSEEDVASTAAMAGMLYVLEGSRLGGRFLARSIPETWPRAYLGSQQPPHMWRELLVKLDALLYEPDTLETAVTAANQTFGRFEAAGAKWLAKVV
ncbi:biliverdin-producing heme oxygenase [Sphingomonas sp. R1]|uniref:biliverdin-producing heme oxygenase n=1 Tax=Sphingomonas sp. R1 TaxID=399176 RepID=UPI002225175F|nr:biliverdin-producing heme oxygenase [Sphingomonas sp. R1]UYY77109.1 biliverdin-producing heme oxygenase [Sphingomonas sp. R1]